MFISIASYRDRELLLTLKSLISEATHPERLRIVLYNQQDFWNDWDRKIDQDLIEYIDEVQK